MDHEALRKLVDDVLRSLKSLGRLISAPRYYIPHHAVLKGSSLTIKLRVVFDASCKSNTGISLNECLSVGPTLQEDLFSILLRFRTFQYVITADIAQMYRQVLIDESQTSLQTIFWRADPTEEVAAFELKTVTYGTACASFLAVRAMQELASIYASIYPVGSITIVNDFYVDDLLSGADTEQEIRTLRNETIKILSSGGFHLRKWASNYPKLLQDIPHADICEPVHFINTDEEVSCDIVLLAQLIDKILRTIRFKPESVYYWTDSMIVIHWIKATDKSWNAFIANRVSEILYHMLHSKDHQNKLDNLLKEDFIEWHFIPPHAPHFGGIWEAAVKSTKLHLKRIVGDTPLTFEEMYTVLTQVEAVLNSRPISPLSNDPNDLSYLTPGHFLVGDSLTTVLQQDVTHLPNNRLLRWQRVSQIFQHFWKRWSREYLQQLQQRTKWQRSKGPHPVIGDMVMVQENNSLPLQWAVGRIEDVYSGTDGVSRVVSVRTVKGTYKRPITKICILPIRKED
ncbi:hypothetical protein ALC60_03312 [Trachymyrmex zeteki]|uniref:DUF5641 domain-containing protein n=1 Tax=Mycetomoellerius zeteki TaxID=64791 RepID=A0A151XBN9_9HYME|nr:hypothetical protein ALC60_03312 [Trachymyrmex zeteki]